MKKFVFGLLALGVALQSCSSDDDNNTPPVDENEVVAPETFTFLRDGASTVSFSGQTTRILMAEELISALKEPSRSEEELLAKQAFMHND